MRCETTVGMGRVVSVWTVGPGEDVRETPVSDLLFVLRAGVGHCGGLWKGDILESRDQ
jgi:hypothetical protein